MSSKSQGGTIRFTHILNAFLGHTSEALEMRQTLYKAGSLEPKLSASCILYQVEAQSVTISNFRFQPLA